MKKILIIFLILISLVSCKKKEEIPVPGYTYEIVSERVDMSEYEGVSSTDHNFRLIKVSELFNTIDSGSSGIFYLGRTNCGCCQKVCRYLSEVAKELNVTIYYIDVYNEEEDLTEDKQLQDKLYDYLYEILGTDGEGNKTLLTPQVFSVVNGKFYGSQICFDDYELDSTPSETQIERFKDSYRKLMKPFTE
ncbi:MAG: hypothetical protein IJU42_05420 [Erysipelotrichaceae bacterium]|jgi:predicted bacteriocin transport accessory protein|nr:hypothetical protein [Erysipelotrichaceae bacterium]